MLHKVRSVRVNRFLKNAPSSTYLVSLHKPVSRPFTTFMNWKPEFGNLVWF